MPRHSSRRPLKQRVEGSPGCARAAANPDFHPSCKRIKDAKPQAVFIFLPQASSLWLLKGFNERGLDIGGYPADRNRRTSRRRNDRSDGRHALGVVTSHHYSALTTARRTKLSSRRFADLDNAHRPNFMAVGGWDWHDGDLMKWYAG